MQSHFLPLWEIPPSTPEFLHTHVTAGHEGGLRLGSSSLSPDSASNFPSPRGWDACCLGDSLLGFCIFTGRCSQPCSCSPWRKVPDLMFPWTTRCLPPFRLFRMAALWMDGRKERSGTAAVGSMQLYLNTGHLVYMQCGSVSNQRIILVDVPGI